VNHLNVNGSTFIENHQEPILSGRENRETGYFCYLQLSFTGFVAFLFRGIIMPAKAFA